MRVLVFGDSITQGFWDTEGGWAQRLRQYYDNRQLENLRNRDEPSIFNLGISGDITKGLLLRVENEIIARKWRWPHEEITLIFAIGINDSASMDGKEVSSPPNYRKELTELLEKSKKFTNRIIFVGLTPVEEDKVNYRTGKFKEFTNSRIVEFDNALNNFCKENDLLYVPTYEEFRSQLKENNELLPDGLHPNNDGHELIFKLVQPKLDKLLGIK
jgi:lysophospholipase L1-like esterase